MKATAVEHDNTKLLVNRAKCGDRVSFDTLVERFRPRLRDSVRSWSRFQLGPPLEVEEVLQETFVRAFRSLKNFEWQDDDAFFRWLCGIAKRAMAQAVEDAHRERLRKASSFGNPPISETTQSQALRRDERFERLQHSLEKLRPEYRKVIILSRIKGLTMKEIAEEMGRSPSTVKYFLTCALKELRKHFGETESFHLPNRRLDTEGEGNHG